VLPAFQGPERVHGPEPRQSKGHGGKGRRRVTIPVGPPLKAALDGVLKEKRSAVTILVKSFGRPWTEDGFRTSWDKAFRRTSLKDLHFHDLRGTAVTRLAPVELLGTGDRFYYWPFDEDGAGDPGCALPWRSFRTCGVSDQETKRGLWTSTKLK
jgi:hypothetical protein